MLLLRRKRDAGSAVMVANGGTDPLGLYAVMVGWWDPISGPLGMIQGGKGRCHSEARTQALL